MGTTRWHYDRTMASFGCISPWGDGMEPDPTLAIYDDGSIVKCLHEMQAMIDPPTAIMVGKRLSGL